MSIKRFNWKEKAPDDTPRYTYYGNFSKYVKECFENLGISDDKSKYIVGGGIICPICTFCKDFEMNNLSQIYGSYVLGKIGDIKVVISPWVKDTEIYLASGDGYNYFDDLYYNSDNPIDLKKAIKQEKNVVDRDKLAKIYLRG